MNTTNKLLGTMGGAIESLLIDELSMIKGFLNAIEILKKEYTIDEEIEESIIISLMVGEAMKEAKGSLNPNSLGAKAKEYLSCFSIIESLIIGRHKVQFTKFNGLYYANIFLVNSKSSIIQLDAKSKVTVEAKARNWISEQEIILDKK